eukprot:TRINITY_DN91998_c0_g1_i1.p1 TRINITY_DN91998_c0_g1~~TRINITY_DN91998_c0_g1_i1.p1  ORF type:complete len:587 (+),score=127.45 TRINITY_DN91998_c0_g1_i1:120-1880(+)
MAAAPASVAMSNEVLLYQQTLLESQAQRALGTSTVGFGEVAVSAAVPTTLLVFCVDDAVNCVTEDLVREWSEYGEIARVDTSLKAMLRTVLVTYFDVRSAKAALLAAQRAGRPVQAATAGSAHDVRAASMPLQTMATLGSFSQYGEVANVAVVGGEMVVEFFDLRACQALLVAAQGLAQAWTPPMQKQQQQNPSVALHQQAQQALATAMLSAASSTAPRADLTKAYAAQMGKQGAADSPGGVAGGQGLKLPLEPPSLLHMFPPPGMAGGAGAADAVRPGPLLAEQQQAPASPSKAMSPKSFSPGGESSPNGAGGDMGNRPQRTKVAMKDFSKYDIDPEKVIRGGDTRTTVMVRHLTGNNSRKDFMNFLDKCGLSEKYTFFYMPCKEHRNIPAGFAFVNFSCSQDVLQLYLRVRNGLWREVCTEPMAKTPAVSYARFQGQDELMRHFSASAVLHESDPDKRPIFRTKAGAHLQELGSLSPNGSLFSSPVNSPQRSPARSPVRGGRVMSMASFNLLPDNASEPGSPMSPKSPGKWPAAPPPGLNASPNNLPEAGRFSPVHAAKRGDAGVDISGRPSYVHVPTGGPLMR